MVTNKIHKIEISEKPLKTLLVIRSVSFKLTFTAKLNLYIYTL